MIIVFFIMLSVITVLIFYIIVDKSQPQTGNGKKDKAGISYDPNSELIKTVKLRKMLGIKSIKNNLITTDDNNLTCILDVSTPEFGLMTEEDQTLYENNLIELIFKIKYSFKVITTVNNKNLKNVIEILEENRKNISDDRLNSYSINLQNELNKEQNDMEIKKYYAIYSGEKGSYEEKLKELTKKEREFKKDFEAMGCSVKTLATNEILELMNTLIKKYDKLDMQYIEESNVFDVAI